MRIHTNAIRNRNTEIDIWRFWGAIIIMIHHLYTTGMNGSEYGFHDGYIFVEFFFLLTGYYTASHFKNNSNVITLEEKIKNGLKYAFHKYKSFFYICGCATTAQYLLLILSDYISPVDKTKNLVNFPADLLLITGLYQRPLVTSLWYLSAMCIVLPFVSIAMQSSNRIFNAFFSFVLIGIYYGYVLPTLLIPYGLDKGCAEDLLRAFICMYAGCFILEMSDYISKFRTSKKNDIILFLLSEFCMFFVIIEIYTSRITFIHSVLAFICAIICMCSRNYSATNNITSYLGKISLYIYIWNWVVGSYIKNFMADFSATNIKILYFSVTILLAVLSDICMKYLHRKRKVSGK